MFVGEFAKSCRELAVFLANVPFFILPCKLQKWLLAGRIGKNMIRGGPREKSTAREYTQEKSTSKTSMRPNLGAFVLVLLWHSCVSIPIVNQNVQAQKPLESLITEKGYPLEKYNTTTKDGYKLSLWRIPHGRNSVKGQDLTCDPNFMSRSLGTSDGSRPVVFLQHGLEDNCEGWFSNSANESLGFILADAGFDVFAGRIPCQVGFR